jgi:predicted PhzF superfamily epimerase YddE/YHI9
LRDIAVENNLAETAFFVQISSNRFHLRWFTPEIEMDLCGHATLASAFVIFEYLDCTDDEISFDTQSGLLKVKKVGDCLELDLPSRPPRRADLPKIIVDGLNIQPVEVWKARDYLLLYDTEEEIKQILPNIGIMNQINIDPGGIIVTARSKAADVDFVSRFFTPQAAVFEDPVTGSAHCTLVPFWAERLGKTEMHALQVSERGGALWCKLQNERVFIMGKAVKYLEGIIEF